MSWKYKKLTHIFLLDLKLLAGAIRVVILTPRLKTPVWKKEVHQPVRNSRLWQSQSSVLMR